MKKLFALTLVLMLALTLCVTAFAAEEGINWNALTEGATTTEVSATDAAVTEMSETFEPFDWSDIITKVIVWILGLAGTALSACIGLCMKKYVIPWLRDVAIPWLKQKKLLNAAQTAVEYAEATVGRLNGQIKWEIAEDTLKNLGYDINSTEVITAAKAAWQQLDISQYAAGIKTMLDAENPEKTPEKDAVFGDSDSPVEGL